MAKTYPNPIFEASFPKLDDVTKVMSAFKMTSLDMAELMNIQRKNVEAITAIQQTVYANMQTMAKQQVEWMQQAFAEGSLALNTIISSSSPSQKLKQQAKFTKSAVEKNIASTQQAIETLGKCNGETMDIINNRMCDSMEEMSALNTVNQAA